jgi:hypothetical protein
MVFDHGTFEWKAEPMEEMAISKFKATCLATLERVGKTKKPLRVTRFGVPVAEIVPPSLSKRSAGWLGCMEGTVDFVGDVIAPAIPAEEWDALR